MNVPLFMAGCLTILLGLVHSLVGEPRILRAIEEKTGIAGEPLASRRQMQVLRGTWHTLSLFGFGLGIVLFTLAIPSVHGVIGITGAIAVALAIVGVYWAYATRLWHPAWIVFLLASALCWWS